MENNVNSNDQLNLKVSKKPRGRPKKLDKMMKKKEMEIKNNKKIEEYTEKLKNDGVLQEVNNYKCNGCNKEFSSKNIMIVTFCLTGGRLSMCKDIKCDDCCHN